jgi:DNA replication protein DnaC
LENFNWKFNAKSIDRVQMEQLATGDFVRRGDNLVFVGQSGLGKSHLIQSIGRSCCVHGYRVCYRTSAELLSKLGQSLADGTTAKRIRQYARYDLLIIDEFGFDKLEREDFPQASSLLYKVIDSRTRSRSTALVTNIDFDAWGDYLGDPPMAMAFLDRVVDGAMILKLHGKSYRAHRAQKPSGGK